MDHIHVLQFLFKCVQLDDFLQFSFIFYICNSHRHISVMYIVIYVATVDCSFKTSKSARSHSSDEDNTKPENFIWLKTFCLLLFSIHSVIKIISCSAVVQHIYKYYIFFLPTITWNAARPKSHSNMLTRQNQTDSC